MTKTAIAYQCDAQGNLVGETLVQEDAFEKGAFLLPPGCTLSAPPRFDSDRQRVCFSGGAWTVMDLAAAPATEAPPAPSVPTADNRPEAGESEIAIIVGGQWQLVPDYRGQIYWLPDGSKHVVHAIGELVPPGALDAPPPAKEPDPAPLNIDVEQFARQMRSSLLRASDWIVLRALETGTVVAEEWVQYRQALRDAPKQPGWPADIKWPVPPAQ